MACSLSEARQRLRETVNLESQKFPPWYSIGRRGENRMTGRMVSPKIVLHVNKRKKETLLKKTGLVFTSK